MNRGMLIAFEGIDGTGKSTHLPLLAQFLRDKKCEVVETREPTEGPYGQQIRALYRNRAQATLDQELELFLQDRRQHVRECIEPALQAGKIVLTDRYYFSTAAYQGAAGGDPAKIFALNSFAPEPDLVVLLTQTPEQSIARIRGRRGDIPNDFEQLSQLEKVAQLFDSFAHPFIVRIPTSRPMADVQSSIRAVVLPLLQHQGVQ